MRNADRCDDERRQQIAEKELQRVLANPRDDTRRQNVLRMRLPALHTAPQQSTDRPSVDWKRTKSGNQTHFGSEKSSVFFKKFRFKLINQLVGSQ